LIDDTATLIQANHLDEGWWRRLFSSAA